MRGRHAELETTVSREERTYREAKAANKEAVYRAARARYNSAVDELESVTTDLPRLAQTALDLDARLSRVETQMRDEIQTIAQQEARGRRPSVPVSARGVRASATPVTTPTRQARTKTGVSGPTERIDLGPAMIPCDRCKKKGSECIVGSGVRKVKGKGLNTCLACRTAKLGCSGVFRT